MKRGDLPVGDSDVPALRSVGSGDREAIVDVMVRAFHEDPGPLMIEPDRASSSK